MEEPPMITPERLLFWQNQRGHVPSVHTAAFERAIDTPEFNSLGHAIVQLEDGSLYSVRADLVIEPFQLDLPVKPPESVPGSAEQEWPRRQAHVTEDVPTATSTIVEYVIGLRLVQAGRMRIFATPGLTVHQLSHLVQALFKVGAMAVTREPTMATNWRVEAVRDEEGNDLPVPAWLRHHSISTGVTGWHQE